MVKPFVKSGVKTSVSCTISKIHFFPVCIVKDIINPYKCLSKNDKKNFFFFENSLLVLKTRYRVFSFASKKVQEFSSDGNILMLV